MQLYSADVYDQSSLDIWGNALSIFKTGKRQNVPAFFHLMVWIISARAAQGMGTLEFRSWNIWCARCLLLRVYLSPELRPLLFFSFSKEPDFSAIFQPQPVGTTPVIWRMGSRELLRRVADERVLYFAVACFAACHEKVYACMHCNA